jgi:hypothetical protein
MIKLKVDFCDFWPNFVKTDNYFFNLLSTKYDVAISEKPDVVFYSGFGKEAKKYEGPIRVYYTGENRRPNMEECDYSFSFDYDEYPENYRLPLWALFINWFNVPHSEERDISYLVPLQDLLLRSNVERKTKFCNFVFSNVAGKRGQILNEIARFKRVDCAGNMMNNMGWKIPGRGDQKHKIDFIRDYRFTIAAENSAFPGYTTEKILHPLSVGSIPIYWGSNRVSEDFNKDAFICVDDFDEIEEMVYLIEDIEEDEELYEQYIKAPVFPEGKVPEGVEPSNVLKFLEEVVLC